MQVTGATRRCSDAWSLAVPVRVVIVRQGPAPCFQQVTDAMGRCKGAWLLSVPWCVIVGQ